MIALIGIIPIEYSVLRNDRFLNIVQLSLNMLNTSLTTNVQV